MKNGQMKDEVEMDPRIAGITRVSLTVLALVALSGGQAMGQFGGMGGFGGMSGVGSQDPSGSAQQSPRLAFRPWISATGSYAEVPASSVSGGTRNTTGLGGSAGVSGGRSWQRTSFAGFYTAAYQRWGNRSLAEGLSNAGGFSVTHQLSSRARVFAAEFAGSSLGGYGYGAPGEAWGGNGLAGTSVFFDITGGGLDGMTNPAQNGLVDNEMISGRVHFTGTTGGVVYQPSLRWSYSAQTSASFVRRKDPSLADLNAYSAAGSAAYRINQNSQLTFQYAHGWFTYPNMFGGNRVHQAVVGYTVSLTPQVHVGVMGGAYRFNSTFVGQKAIDASLAGLLGQSSILDLKKMSCNGWVGGAHATRTFRRYSANISYNRTMSPGNGVILASDRDSVTSSLSSSAGRFSFAGYGSYYRMTGIQQNGAKTESYGVGGNVGMKVIDDLYFGVNGGYRTYDTPYTTSRWSRYVAATLSWSPSDAMFRF